MAFNLFNKNKRLSAEDLREVRELNQLVMWKIWELAQLKDNTALLTNGQMYVKNLEEVINILETKKRMVVGMKLTALGCPQNKGHSINLKTGEITMDAVITTPVAPVMPAEQPTEPKPVALSEGNRAQRRKLGHETK
jgi:hypothetical protein